MRLPKIRIKYNLTIDPIFVFYCKNNPNLKTLGWNDWIPPTKKEIIQNVKNYKAEWKKYEEKILTNLIQITGLEFINPIINVHIVSGNPRQIGFPLIIKIGFSPNEFINVLTHELIHYLFEINKPEKIENKLPDKYQRETNLTKKHIIVYAILKYLYLDILNEQSRLEKNLSESKKHRTNDYIRAWEIVETEGYKKIISDFREEIKKGAQN